MEPISNTPEYENTIVKVFGRKAKEKIVNWSLEFESNYLKGYKVYDKTFDLATKAESSFIWSNNHSKTIKKVLEKENLLNIFKEVVGKDAVKYIKPKIDGFNIIHKSNNELKDYLFIGNAKTDNQAALKANIDFIHISKLQTQL